MGLFRIGGSEPLFCVGYEFDGGLEEVIFMIVLPVVMGLCEIEVGANWVREVVHGLGSGDSKKLILSFFIYFCIAGKEKVEE